MTRATRATEKHDESPLVTAWKAARAEADAAIAAHKATIDAEAVAHEVKERACERVNAAKAAMDAAGLS